MGQRMQYKNDIDQLFETIDDLGRDLARELMTQQGPARGPLHQLLWRCRRHLTHPLYVSQAGQDHFIDQHITQGKREGIFVDVGGYDGITGSNSYFFEAVRGWSGILIEPVPEHCDVARSVRQCPCVQECVAAAEGTQEFLQVREGYTQMSGLLTSYDDALLEQVRSGSGHEEAVWQLDTVPLATLLRRHGLTHVDCLFLDIEGAELDVLRSFDPREFHISVCCIENNTGGPELQELMSAMGYRRVEFIGMDEIYVSE